MEDIQNEGFSTGLVATTVHERQEGKSDMGEAWGLPETENWCHRFSQKIGTKWEIRDIT
jgi:hypothetical protein